MARRRTLSEYRTKKKIVLAFAPFFVVIGATGPGGGTVGVWVEATLAVGIGMTLVWLVLRPRRWYVDDRVPTDAR